MFWVNFMTRPYYGDIMICRLDHPVKNSHLSGINWQKLVQNKISVFIVNKAVTKCEALSFHSVSC